MRREFLTALVLSVAAIPAGMAASGAIEYFSYLKDHPGLSFWGSTLVTLALFALAAALAVRGERDAEREGAKKRMTPLIGMIVCGVGFVGFAAWYFWPPQSSVQAIGAPPAPSPDPGGGETKRGEAKKADPVIAVDCRLATLPGTVSASGINTLDFVYMPGDGGPIGVGGTTSPPGTTLTWPTDRLMYCEFTTHDSRELYSVQFNLHVSFHEVAKLLNGTIQNGALIKEREWPIAITRINSNYSFGFYAFTTGDLMVYVTLPKTVHYFDAEANQQLDARLLVVNWQAMSFAPANAMKPTSRQVIYGI